MTIDTHNVHQHILSHPALSEWYNEKPDENGRQVMYVTLNERGSEDVTFKVTVESVEGPALDYMPEDHPEYPDYHGVES